MPMYSYGDSASYTDALKAIENQRQVMNDLAAQQRYGYGGGSGGGCWPSYDGTYTVAADTCDTNVKKEVECIKTTTQKPMALKKGDRIRVNTGGLSGVPEGYQKGDTGVVTEVLGGNTVMMRLDKTKVTREWSCQFLDKIGEVGGLDFLEKPVGLGVLALLAFAGYKLINKNK